MSDPANVLNIPAEIGVRVARAMVCACVTDEDAFAVLGAARDCGLITAAEAANIGSEFGIILWQPK